MNIGINKKLDVPFFKKEKEKKGETQKQMINYLYLIHVVFVKKFHLNFSLNKLLFNEYWNKQKVRCSFFLKRKIIFKILRK